MQYMRNTTMTKTDRDTLRSLHGRKKWEHIWAYYKLPIAIVLIVVYILGYAAYRHVTKKEDVLYLGLVNITAGSDLTEQLTTGFAEAQCLTKKQQVDLLSGLLLSESEHAEEQYVYASEGNFQKIKRHKRCRCQHHESYSEYETCALLSGSE